MILSALAQQPLLYWGGAGMFALTALFTVLIFFDHRTVTGINPWIKPTKFAVSIGIYYWTIAWLLQYVGPAHYISRGTFWLLVIEMVCIALQAARGVRSHFNRTTPFDGVIFTTMGIAIFANTWLAFRLFRLFGNVPVNLAPAYRLGIRLGLAIFIAASMQGLVMVSRRAHSVGVPDGGPGLPFLNWSTRGGDLRVAHFLGLHAIQIMPAAGYFAPSILDEPIASRTVIALAIGLSAVMILTLAQALAGRPLLRPLK